MLGLNPCVFLPDDRTIIFDQEDVIRGIASGEEPAPPAYLRDKEWERASRGLVAIAVKNRDDSFTKHYDLGRPDDAVVLSLFKGADWWVIGVDDADPIVLHADASCRDRDASQAISRSIDSLIKLGRQYSEHNVPKSSDAKAHDQIARMLKALAANVRVVQTDNAIAVHAENFGSLADFGVIVAGEQQEAKAQVAAGHDAKHSVKQVDRTSAACIRELATKPAPSRPVGHDHQGWRTPSTANHCPLSTAICLWQNQVLQGPYPA